MLTTETFRKAARDPAEFGSYYLAHYFTRRSPPFHRQLSALWRRRVMKNRDPVSDCAAMLTEKGTRSAIAAPRGHAKSTVMSLQNVLHAALFGYKRYILLVSDTEAQAVSFLDAIKNELETNERILADFGEQPGKTWKTGSILLSNGCRIDAVGSGQKLRGRRNYGRRPDLSLCDDIENDEGVRTAEQRQKTADWFWKAVCKSGDSYTDILVIGTILHHDSLLAGLLENPGFQSRKYRAVLSDATSPLWTDWERLASDLTDPDREKTAHAFYFKHRKEMLAGSKVLWPEKLSYYDLRLMRLTEGDAAFNSEMQNQPIDPAACLFSAQWFRYYNPAEVDFRAADFRFYGYCDPSLGRTASSDYSAIVTLAVDRNTGLSYVWDADIQRRHPDKIIADILEKERLLRRETGRGYALFGAETNQFQWFLKEQLARESARHHAGGDPAAGRKKRLHPLSPGSDAAFAAAFPVSPGRPRRRPGRLGGRPHAGPQAVPDGEPVRPAPVKNSRETCPACPQKGKRPKLCNRQKTHVRFVQFFYERKESIYDHSLLKHRPSRPHERHSRGIPGHCRGHRP